MNHQGDIFLRASLNVMATSSIILALVGMVSGFWPALKAARLEPIAALRAESRLFSKSRFTVGGFAVDWERLAEILR